MTRRTNALRSVVSYVGILFICASLQASDSRQPRHDDLGERTDRAPVSTTGSNMSLPALPIVRWIPRPGVRGIGYDGRYLYQVSGNWVNPDPVHRIDPMTGEWEEIFLWDYRPFPMGITWDGTSFYVTDDGDPIITVVDADFAYQRELSLESDWLMDLAFDGTDLLVGRTAAGISWIWIVDPRSGTIKRRMPILRHGGEHVAGVGWDGRFIWAGTTGGRIFRIDRTGNVVDKYRSPAGHTWGGYGGEVRGLAFDGKHMWCHDFHANNLFELVIPLPLEIEVRIPGPYMPVIDLGSTKTVAVAVLGSADLDVLTLDPSTLRLGPDGAPPIHDLDDHAMLTRHLRDVNHDGIMDLVGHYGVTDSGIGCNNDFVVLRVWERAEDPPDDEEPQPCNCCEEHDWAGCDDLPCEHQLCAFDPYCCSASWDGTCAQEAPMFPACTHCCGGEISDCCETHPWATCSNRDCVELVCDLDSSCCNSAWDDDCVGWASQLPECVRECEGVDPGPPGQPYFGSALIETAGCGS